MQARIGAAALLLLSALGMGSVGCELIFLEKLSLKNRYVLQDPSDKKSFRDRFWEFGGKIPSKPGPLPQGIGVAPIYFYEPFSMTTAAGIFDASKLAVSSNATGCIEIDEKGTFGSPGHFFTMCARYEATPAIGTRILTLPGNADVFYPDIRNGVMTFSESAGTLQFLYLPQGGITPDLIDTQTFTSPTTGWFPSLGANNLFKGGVLDFDNTDWTNGPLPGGATTEETIARGFENAMLEMNHACGSLDGFAPDSAGAAGHLTDSFAFITATRSLLPTLSDPRLEKKVSAKLDCLDKNAGKAYDLSLELRYDPAISKINKGLACGGDGLVLLRDFKVNF